jgi:hypothetical protein
VSKERPTHYEEVLYADFEVGELSGCLRDILTTAGKSLQCTHKGSKGHRAQAHHWDRGLTVAYFLRTVKLGKGANGERLFVIVFGFEHPTAQKELQTLLSSFEVPPLRQSLFLTSVCNR